MDLVKFVSLLDSVSLWLARSDTFKYQSEGRFHDEMRIALESAYESFEEKEGSPINNVHDFQLYQFFNRQKPVYLSSSSGGLLRSQTK
jgi:hypothetical protein